MRPRRGGYADFNSTETRSIHDLPSVDSKRVARREYTVSTQFIDEIRSHAPFNALYRVKISSHVLSVPASCASPRRHASVIARVLRSVQDARSRANGMYS